MTDATETALIVAGAALAGVLVSALVASRLQRQLLLRAKYEEMALAFTDFLGWLGSLNSARTRDEMLAHAYSTDARRAR